MCPEEVSVLSPCTFKSFAHLSRDWGRSMGEGGWMWLASFKIYELLNLEMSFFYCQWTASVFLWVTKKKIAITSFARASMSNTKWVQLIILTTKFTLDKQSVYQMMCPRKVVILTKCYSLQLCSSHYRIANSSLKEKTVQAKYETAFICHFPSGTRQQPAVAENMWSLWSWYWIVCLSLAGERSFNDVTIWLVISGISAF